MARTATPLGIASGLNVRTLPNVPFSLPRPLRLACGAFWLTACLSYSGRGAPATGAERATSPRAGLASAWNALRGDDYPLDGFERGLEPGQRVRCDQKGMVLYRGTSLRYAGSVLVDPSFRERLQRFETVAAQTALEVYGRQPRLVRHYGAFSCRATRNRSYVVSEHALGNALDLVGFDFGAASKSQPLPEGLPRQLTSSFQVRVARHFLPRNSTDRLAATHSRFFSLLTERLRQRDDIFRCMFGPNHGGHDDHFHLDAAPWRYVDL